MNFGWSRSKFPNPLPPHPPFPFREIYILSVQKHLSPMFFIKIYLIDSHACLPSVMASMDGKVASFGGYRLRCGGFAQTMVPSATDFWCLKLK